MMKIYGPLLNELCCTIFKPVCSCLHWMTLSILTSNQSLEVQLKLKHRPTIDYIVTWIQGLAFEYDNVDHNVTSFYIFES